MSRARAVSLDRKVALALGTLRHVALERRDDAHGGRTGGCADDFSTVIGFIVEADYAASLMLHGLSHSFVSADHHRNVTGLWRRCRSYLEV